jgi:hypothetical protein
LPIKGIHLDISIDQKAQKDECRYDDLSDGKDFFRPVAKDPEEGGIDQKDDKRETIGSSNICHLDKRKVEILRISQVRPGESGQQKGAEVFQGNPYDWGEERSLESQSQLNEPRQKREDPNKKAQVDNQDQEDEAAQNDRDIAICVKGDDDPVEDSDKRDETGQKSKDKAVERRFPFHRHEERDQSNPGQEFEIQIREREDKKNA